MLLKRDMLSKVRWVGFVLAIAAGSATSYGQIGAQSPQPQSTSIAVVDMEHVLDNHPSFTSQMEAMKAEFQKTMEDFETRRKKLASDFQGLGASLAPDSPEYKQKEEIGRAHV